MTRPSTRPIRHDLYQQLAKTEEQGLCLAASSASEARRLNNAVARGTLISPAPRVFARPEYWSELSKSSQQLHIIRTLSIAHPDWTFCHVSAALVHGLAVSHRLLDGVHVVTSRESHTSSTTGIMRHIVSSDETEVIQGIRVTSLGRTAFDCMRSTGFRGALAIADSALRVGRLTNKQLVEGLAKFGQRIAGHARISAVASLADGRTESGGESIVRAIMYELGIMQPELQVPTYDVVDGTYYRADFCWRLPGGQVLGELDGREKYRNLEMTNGRDVVDVLADERLRESRISGNGVRIMRFSYADAIDTTRFLRILRAYGIPEGYPIPEVARQG